MGASARDVCVFVLVTSEAAHGPKKKKKKKKKRFREAAPNDVVLFPTPRSIIPFKNSSKSCHRKIPSSLAVSVACSFLLSQKACFEEKKKKKHLMRRTRQPPSRTPSVRAAEIRRPALRHASRLSSRAWQENAQFIQSSSHHLWVGAREQQKGKKKISARKCRERKRER